MAQDPLLKTLEAMLAEQKRTTEALGALKREVESFHKANLVELRALEEMFRRLLRLTDSAVADTAPPVIRLDEVEPAEG